MMTILVLNILYNRVYEDIIWVFGRTLSAWNTEYATSDLYFRG